MSSVAFNIAPFISKTMQPDQLQSPLSATQHQPRQLPSERTRLPRSVTSKSKRQFCRLKLKKQKEHSPEPESAVHQPDDHANESNADPREYSNFPVVNDPLLNSTFCSQAMPSVAFNTAPPISTTIQADQQQPPLSAPLHQQVQLLSEQPPQQQSGTLKSKRQFCQLKLKKQKEQSPKPDTVLLQTDDHVNVSNADPREYSNFTAVNDPQQNSSFRSQAMPLVAFNTAPSISTTFQADQQQTPQPAKKHQKPQTTSCTKEKRYCQFCRNHDKLRTTKGHKKECVYRAWCTCTKCLNTKARHKVNAKQVAIKREKDIAIELSEMAKHEKLVMGADRAVPKPDDEVNNTNAKPPEAYLKIMWERILAVLYRKGYRVDTYPLLYIIMKEITSDIEELCQKIDQW